MKIPMLLGPTAVGKTDLLLAVSDRLPIEVISVDSRQVYKYMDIGTAKPSISEVEQLPHHLVDFVDPDRHFDVYQWHKLALEKVDEVIKKGKIPLLAGGTGLYADALLRGIVEGLPADDGVRSALRNIELDNPGSLRRILEKVDEKAFLKIHPNDLKRTVRYLEVYFTTGRPLSTFHSNGIVSDRITVILLNRDRSELHERIDSRVNRMFEAGLEEEVKWLKKLGYDENLNSMKTIGYREIFSYLDGKTDLNTAIELIKRNTRRYARRQIIWFRRYEKAYGIDLSAVSGENSINSLCNIILSTWGGNSSG